MIDLGRLTVKCTDCPQIIPIAGDLTMNGENRHIYRLGYKGAQSFGVKVRSQYSRSGLTYDIYFTFKLKKWGTIQNSTWPIEKMACFQNK